MLRSSTAHQTSTSPHRRAKNQQQPEVSAALDALGFFLREIRAIELLSPEQEQMHGAQAQTGDRQAWKALVVANLPLVVSIACDHQGQGLDLADLVQEGTFGLMRAATTFNPARKARFVTIATWWIRSTIRRALANHGRIIRLPVKQVEKQQRLARAQARISHESGATATLEEIAESLECDVATIQQLLQQAQQVCSLDAPLVGTEADPITLEETYADPRTAEALEAVEASDSALTVWDVLRTLSEQERQIITLHLGLRGQKPLSFRQIGPLLGISYESARLIELHALQTLRHSQLGRQLWENLHGEKELPLSRK